MAQRPEGYSFSSFYFQVLGGQGPLMLEGSAEVEHYAVHLMMATALQMVSKFLGSGKND